MGTEQVLAGRYRLAERIGSGGMSEVYAADHLLTGRPVAVKLIRAEILDRIPGAEARVLAEAEACGSLDHPNVVQILDGGFTEVGDLFLVFERLYGQSLERALRKSRVTPRSLVRIAVRVLDALGAVHGREWVHRDVKPGNVFLARDALGSTIVKLIDFGIAAPLEASAVLEGPILGTRDYMSPEQTEGHRLDGRSDLWSVGALLFRGLTGSVPFVGDAREAVFVKGRPPPSPYGIRPDLPLDLCGVVRRFLQPDPRLRWSRAEDAISALAAVDEGALAGLPPPQFAFGGAPPAANEPRSRPFTV
ncbi:MAG: serine/threonine-protein kinase [Myxococcota bacterium]